MNSRQPRFGRFGAISTSAIAGLALLALCGGCNRDKVEVYRVGKEPVREKVNAPEGWTSIPRGQMRVAAFAVKGGDGKVADVSVIPLPGAAGGVEANVNRWRGQVGLLSLSEAEIKKSAEIIQIAGQPAELYDLAGTNASSGEPIRILAAIQNRENTAWFYKMTGDDQLVAKQKPAFIAYFKTFDPNATPEPSGLPESHPPIDSGALPPGHPEITPTAATGAGEISREGQPKWEVPAGWKEVPGGQFLAAKFIIAGEAGAQASVNVSTSPGQGGGLEENVNRWRKQLALTSLSSEQLAAAVQALETSAGKASVVEMTGTDAKSGQPAKLVGVFLPMSDHSWFYKMMGDAKVVDAHKDEFKKFVQSAKY